MKAGNFPPPLSFFAINSRPARFWPQVVVYSDSRTSTFCSSSTSDTRCLRIDSHISFIRLNGLCAERIVSFAALSAHSIAFPRAGLRHSRSAHDESFFISISLNDCECIKLEQTTKNCFCFFVLALVLICKMRVACGIRASNSNSQIMAKRIRFYHPSVGLRFMTRWRGVIGVNNGGSR